MSRLANLLRQVLATAAADRGVTVTIRRGAQSTTGVTAVVGKSMLEQSDGDGGFVTVETRDYLFDASAYRLGGVAVAPAAGDLIEETVDGAACVYEALPIESEDAYRHTDPHRAGVRVHTKQKSET